MTVETAESEGERFDRERHEAYEIMMDERRIRRSLEERVAELERKVRELYEEKMSRLHGGY